MAQTILLFHAEEVRYYLLSNINYYTDAWTLETLSEIVKHV